jgi:ribosomal protein S18 acetylase RimI-like enzyme
VDPAGQPWVLEVNANPCIAPDSGFVAAAERASIDFPQLVQRIIADIPAQHGTGRRALAVSSQSLTGYATNGLHSSKKKVEARMESPSPGGETPEHIWYREEVKPEDREHVRAIVESSGFFSHAEVAIAVELVEEYLTKGVQSGYYFLFAEYDNQVVGYTCFGPIPGTMHSYDLYWIAVHNQYRGLGIGKALLGHSERVIAHLGGQRIYIETSSRAQYKPTQAFYAACEYRQEAKLEDFYAPGDGKIIYVKTV